MQTSPPPSIPPDAPPSVAGFAIGVTITGGNGPFATNGYYIIAPADSGPTYQLIGVDGVANSSGTYSYTSSNSPVGYINVIDSQTGAVSGTINFPSGTIVLTSGPYRQTGNFMLSALPVYDSIGGTSVYVSVRDGAEPFAYAGGGVLTFSATGNTYTILDTAGGIVGSSGTYSYSKLNASTGALVLNDSETGTSTTYLGLGTASSGSYLTTQPSSGGFQVGVFSVTRAIPAAFFVGEIDLNSEVDYLQFFGGNVFGYYNVTSFTFPLFYHYDLGFEYFFDANNPANGCYLYDFSSSTFFYTTPSLFPYLYDFNLNAWLFYFPDPNNPGHYTSNPRAFYNFDTGQVITK